METWIYVLEGGCVIQFDKRDRKTSKLVQDDCLIVYNQEQYTLKIEDDKSIVMVVTMVPTTLPSEFKNLPHINVDDSKDGAK